MNALYERLELTGFYKKLNPLLERIDELAPSPERTSGVWLYRGSPAS